MKKKNKEFEESEDKELEVAGEFGDEQPGVGSAAVEGEDASLLGQLKKIQEQLFYLERKVDQILERGGGGGPRRDFGGGGGGFNRNRGGGGGPRRDFRGGGDRGPRRDFRGGGGDRGPRREFGGGDRGESRGNRDFGGGEGRRFGGGGEGGSPRQWNRRDQ